MKRDIVGVVLTTARYFATHTVSPEAQATMWQVVDQMNAVQWQPDVSLSIQRCARIAGVRGNLDAVARQLKRHGLVSSRQRGSVVVTSLGAVFADLAPLPSSNKSIQSNELVSNLPSAADERLAAEVRLLCRLEGLNVDDGQVRSACQIGATRGKAQASYVVGIIRKAARRPADGGKGAPAAAGAVHGLRQQLHAGDEAASADLAKPDVQPSAGDVKAAFAALGVVPADSQG